MIPVADAVRRIVAAFSAVAAETVALAEAPGRVLAEDVRARMTQPPAPMSSMDGYAVRAAETPGTLTVIGTAPAGHPYAGKVGPGETVRIFTGGVVPATA
jgi:molybdopterin molybdotransferase